MVQIGYIESACERQWPRRKREIKLAPVTLDETKSYFRICAATVIHLTRVDFIDATIFPPQDKSYRQHLYVEEISFDRLITPTHSLICMLCVLCTLFFRKYLNLLCPIIQCIYGNNLLKSEPFSELFISVGA